MESSISWKDNWQVGEGGISLTNIDWKKACLGLFFRFLWLCVCLGVRRGEG